jgi:hypothetical protein
MAIMLSPIVLPVGAAGLVVLVSIGAVVTGAGLGVTSSSDRVGLTSSARHSVLAHTGLDGLLVIASSFAALALALAGEAPLRHELRDGFLKHGGAPAAQKLSPPTNGLPRRAVRPFRR